jgi:putative inorganic carbon (hco3(-)) transporter
MRHSTPILDYEPLSRARAPEIQKEKTEGYDFGERWSNTQPPSENSGLTKAPPFSNLRVGLNEVKQVILKRGHGISFAGLVVFTAILYFRPYELFPWLSWASSSAFWVAILTLIVYAPTQLGLEGSLTVRPTAINLVLLFLLAAFLSVPLAEDRLVAWRAFVEFLKVVIMFIVMVNVVRTPKRLRVLIFLALFTSCILSVAAVNDYRLDRLVLNQQRIQGFLGNLFDNPNDLALHLVTMIPISLALLLSSRSGLMKLFLGACAILFAMGVVVTFSRGGFFGLIGAVVFMAWRLARKNKWLIAVSLPSALLLFILFAPGGYGSRMVSSADPNDPSGRARRNELKRSLFVATHHPLFGVGIGNYVLYSDINHATHNAYTQVAAELGIPAVAVYILFLVAPLKQLRRVSRETSNSRRTSSFYYMAVGLETSLIGFMISSFFLSVAFLWYVYYVAGYAICLSRLYDASSDGEVGAARKLVVG